MAALGRWSDGAGRSGLVLDATVDALILVGLGLSVLAKSWAARVGATLAGLVALVLVMVNQTYPYPWSGCVILALMFTGTVIYRATEGQLRPWAAAVIALAALALITVAGIWHGAQRHHDYHWQLQWATSVLLAGATFGIGLAAGRLHGTRWRVRVPGWCAWLGMVSYSVYLLHPLVFDAYRSIPVLHRKHPMPGQVLFFAGLLAVIAGLSALTYYLIERPMQRLGRRVARRVGYETKDGAGTAPVASATSAAGPPAAASRSASSSNAVAGGSGGSP
jgi:peptidoglycan/LPS O-acetylase OafA/YrhL